MTEPRLAPKAIAKRLFTIDPDRDERASQLFMEALLAICANNYQPPDGVMASPKLARFAVRSLVFGRNFLDGFPQIVDRDGTSASDYGKMLADGGDFGGADNLPLARSALRNLIDPSTEQGQVGQHLMLPFHESLLWYDARSAAAKFTVRKVRMRGAGITLARMLLDPPPDVSADAARCGVRAVAGLRESLTSESPLGEIASALEAPLGEAVAVVRVEDDEREAWSLGGEAVLAPYAEALCRHADGVMSQRSASAPARLWQLRTIFALDLALNALRRSWAVNRTPEVSRRLLLAIGCAERQRDRVRLRSERSYDEARTALRWATIETIASTMRDLSGEPHVDWYAEIEPRTAKLLNDTVISSLLQYGVKDYRGLAQLAFENANYDRSGEGFRVLLDSIGMSAGGTRFRYLSATPDLLSALVGALSASMPMTSYDFFCAIANEWGLVISPEAARDSDFLEELDGADLVANTRRFEKLMIEAGLATDLSDRTVLVGERAGMGRR